jgi:hypothetical protein
MAPLRVVNAFISLISSIVASLTSSLVSLVACGPCLTAFCLFGFTVSAAEVPSAAQTVDPTAPLQVKLVLPPIRYVPALEELLVATGHTTPEGDTRMPDRFLTLRFWAAEVEPPGIVHVLNSHNELDVVSAVGRNRDRLR